MKIIMDSNGAEFAKQVKADFEKWRAGCGDAVGSLMILGLERAASEGFAPGQKKDPRTKQFAEGPGLDLANRSGKRVFKSGKVVDRSKVLPLVLKGLTFTPRPAGDVLGWGRNSKGTHLTVTQSGESITASVDITAHEKAFVGMEYGQGGQPAKRVDVNGLKVPDTKPGQRKIIQRAFAVTLTLWKKALKGKLDKWIAKCGDQ